MIQPSSSTRLYRSIRKLIGLALGFYFRRIEPFNVEHVPTTGPVLFTSNHPNSLTDSFVLGSAIPRKVNFVATVQLFRFRPMKWLLTQCGVIPINRVKDDPKAMRSIAETFEACFRVLERGEAVGIFPEGITYDDSHLKEIKSGAARMALELENRHEGKLGLRIVPVGLTFSAKEVYRSDALINFGVPIEVATFLEGLADRRKECIRKLTAEIEQRIQSLILHLPTLEHERVILGVKRLYFERLLVGTKTFGPEEKGAEELLLMQRIVDAVEEVYRSDPKRANAFAAKLVGYERWLKRLRLADDHLKLFPEKEKLIGQSLLWATIAILGAPIAVYGWIHRALPYFLVSWAAKHLGEPGKRKAQAATTAITGGIVAFGIFYGLFVWIFYKFFGWPAVLWYALSLPPASLLAHYYLRETRRLIAGTRNIIVLLRAPGASRRLLRRRAELIAEIEAVHKNLAQPQVQTSSTLQS